MITIGIAHTSTTINKAHLKTSTIFNIFIFGQTNTFFARKIDRNLKVSNC